MPFGLTYGAFVAGLGLAMYFGPVDGTPPKSSLALSLGTAVMPWAHFDETLVTLTKISDQVMWRRFNPIFAIGLSDQGTVFISAGLGRRLDVFGVKIMPFTGPAIYFDNNDNDVIQFRTGFEISQTLSDTITLTGGYYHISNGQANMASADLDVAHLGLKLRF